MIVISGALVLVALVLLVLGLTMQDLTFVYGSIAVSLISFVFLVIGILQRRGGQPAAAGQPSGPQVTEGQAPVAEPAAVGGLAKPGSRGSVPVSGRDGDASASGGQDEQGVEDDDREYGDQEHEDEDALALTGATVLVVPGRPRYHVEGCRYLTGKVPEELEVGEAREQYSPCGVCRPDAALEALAATGRRGPDAEDDVAVDADADPAGEVIDSGVPGAEDTDADLEPEPVLPRRGRSRRVDESAPAAAAPARKAAAKPAATSPSRARKAGATAAMTTPVLQPEPDVATPKPAAAPAKAPARRGKVVVIPDRGRFHTADCRFVRDALGTEELTRTQASRQGFVPCGVCKP